MDILFKSPLTWHTANGFHVRKKDLVHPWQELQMRLLNSVMLKLLLLRSKLKSKKLLILMLWLLQRKKKLPLSRLIQRFFSMNLFWLTRNDSFFIFRMKLTMPRKMVMLKNSKLLKKLLELKLKRLIPLKKYLNQKWPNWNQKLLLTLISKMLTEMKSTIRKIANSTAKVALTVVVNLVLAVTFALILTNVTTLLVLIMKSVLMFLVLIIVLLSQKIPKRSSHVQTDTLETTPLALILTSVPMLIPVVRIKHVTTLLEHIHANATLVTLLLVTFVSM